MIKIELTSRKKTSMFKQFFSAIALLLSLPVVLAGVLFMYTGAKRIYENMVTQGTVPAWTDHIFYALVVINFVLIIRGVIAFAFGKRLS